MTTAQPTSDYSSVSEKAGVRVTAEARRMLYTRYAHAASLAARKDVLEVACGPGHGLGLLAGSARRVVGGDLTFNFVEFANAYYRGRAKVLRFDAHALPFTDASFDVVLLFEAIYYLADPCLFLRECRRVLRPGGSLMICTVNCEWPGFNPSPFHTRYYTGRELQEMLSGERFVPELFGAFAYSDSNTVGRLVDAIRSIAVRMHLIPKTMAGKAWLKRLFYGKLYELGPEVTDDGGPASELVPMDLSAPAAFKVIYAVGKADKA